MLEGSNSIQFPVTELQERSSHMWVESRIAHDNQISTETTELLVLLLTHPFHCYLNPPTPPNWLLWIVLHCR